MNIIKTLTFLLLIQTLFCAELLAHGSITAEGDLCVIRIGFYTAHFKIFQPDTSQEKEFCEDLPAGGSSIFVMEYMHQSLGEVPIEFRIIRDVTGLGRFARLEDVNKIADLDAVTVFHQAPVIEPGVFSVLHDFTEEGDFLGIVTVKHPATEQYYLAVFPFHVGPQAWGYLSLFAGIAILSQLSYLFFTGSAQRFLARVARSKPFQHMSFAGTARVFMLAPLLLLMGAAADNTDEQTWLSKSGNIQLSFQSEVEPLPLNRIHGWTLHLENLDGTPVENAGIRVTGGMPAHNHGLPTEPVVTEYLGNGDYRVEGVRFHMQGDWIVEVSITGSNDDFNDTVLVPLTL